MRALPAPLRMAILDGPGAQKAAVLGLFDLLDTSGRLAEKAEGRPVPLPLEVLILPMENGQPPSFTGRLTALVLPPSLHAERSRSHAPDLLAWIRARHGEGTLVCSVCAGAFLLAETGLLEGRPATTHWGLGEDFAARFPGVHLDTDRLVIDDGDLLTAGGLMAWVDLGLRLVHRFLGTATLLATSRHFLVDPGGREQRFYAPFAPVLTHGDAAILRVQHWLQERGGRDVAVPEMAARAHLSERTFLRRFQAATGLTPTDYLQHLRVGRARDRLERTDRSVEAIAWEVGYRDAGAFRKVFQRILGLTPGDYRRRFRV
jgi:transcriptional regulator GlxA family with amidase domain